MLGALLMLVPVSAPAVTAGEMFAFQDKTSV